MGFFVRQLYSHKCIVASTPNHTHLSLPKKKIWLDLNYSVFLYNLSLGTFQLLSRSSSSLGLCSKQKLNLISSTGFSVQTAKWNCILHLSLNRGKIIQKFVTFSFHAFTKFSTKVNIRQQNWKSQIYAICFTKE